MATLLSDERRVVRPAVVAQQGQVPVAVLLVKGRTNTGLIDLGPLQVGVEELFSLRLDGHPLVVLATCDGGLDHSLPDGRSFSLTTPLRSAGASGVLASLWILDDDQAADVLLGFYESCGRERLPGRRLTGCAMRCAPLAPILTPGRA